MQQRQEDNSSNICVESSQNFGDEQAYNNNLYVGYLSSCKQQAILSILLELANQMLKLIYAN